MRVVIADDNSISLGILRGLVLADLKWEVVGEAKTGADAIEACRKTLPDLAILDVNMEPMNGDAAAQAILAQGYAKHVILATGAQHLVAQYRARGMKAITKPYKRGEATKAKVMEALAGGES